MRLAVKGEVAQGIARSVGISMGLCVVFISFGEILLSTVEFVP